MNMKEDVGKELIKKERILFWMLLASAVLIRVIRFGVLPYGVNQDEAMGAVDAWALSLYGTDRFGVRLPVHFSAWQVSQMSVLLSYLMIPFIRLFGFHTWVIRLPMLFVSVGGVVLMYLTGKELADSRFGLIAMALTVINPWHFMQSRWSIDCNLFPHIFLLAFYLLLKGLRKRGYLYLSMIFFGLTFYCYGIAVYSVPVFLAVFALWGLRKKIFRMGEILPSIVIFGVVALPEILVMAINLLHLDTIETGLFTMSRFPDSVRGDDILFLSFSFAQLKANIWAMLRACFLQLPDYWFNAIPAFGPMYHISIPFMLAGMYLLTRDLFREARDETQIFKTAQRLALWGFLLTGIWVGILTREVNVNRINIIFYPLIYMTAYSINILTARSRKITAAVIALYGICGVLFVGSYFCVYPEKVAQYYNGSFLEAVKKIDQEKCDRLYITGNMGWQFNLSMAEILTQYACKIDAQYFQEKTDETGGRKLLPYSQRYHYINAKLYDWQNCEKDALYLLHREDLIQIPEKYEIKQETGDFLVVKIGVDQR